MSAAEKIEDGNLTKPVSAANVVNFPLIFSLPIASNAVFCVGKLPTPIVAGAEVKVDDAEGSKPFIGISVTNGEHKWTACILTLASEAPEDASVVSINQNGLEIKWQKYSSDRPADVAEQWTKTLSQKSRSKVVSMFEKYMATVPSMRIEPLFAAYLRTMEAVQLNGAYICNELLMFSIEVNDTLNSHFYLINDDKIEDLQFYPQKTSATNSDIAILTKRKFANTDSVKLLFQHDGIAEIINVSAAAGAIVNNEQFAAKSVIYFKQSLKDASGALSRAIGSSAKESQVLAIEQYNFCYSKNHVWFSAIIDESRTRIDTLKICSKLSLQEELKINRLSGWLVFAFAKINPDDSYKDILTHEHLELEFSHGVNKTILRPKNSSNPDFLLNHIYENIYSGIKFDTEKQMVVFSAINWLDSMIPSVPWPENSIDFGMIPSQPLATIIIPVYSNYDFIACQIVHFSNDQFMRKSEVIFVIDGKEDFLEEFNNLHNVYKLPFKVLVLGKNYGQARAINSGLAQSRSENIILMDSDVLPVNYNWAEKLVEESTKDSGRPVSAVLLYEDSTVQNAGYNYFTGKFVDTTSRKSFHQIASLKIKADAVSATCSAFSRRFLQDGFLPTGYVGTCRSLEETCIKNNASKSKYNVLPEVAMYHMEKHSSRFSPVHTLGVADWFNNIKVKKISYN